MPHKSDYKSMPMKKPMMPMPKQPPMTSKEVQEMVKKKHGGKKM